MDKIGGKKDLDRKVSRKRAIYRLSGGTSPIDLEAVRSSYPYAGEKHSPTEKARLLFLLLM